jgi:hypothetical protein
MYALGIPTLQGKLEIGEEEEKKPYFLSFLSKNEHHNLNSKIIHSSHILQVLVFSHVCLSFYNTLKKNSKVF